MTREYRDQGQQDTDGGEAAQASAGKRSRAEALPVQRRAAAPAATDEASAGAPALAALDDPFALHLPVQRKQGDDAPAAGGGAGGGSGLPDALRSGVEQLAGVDMSDVSVHRDSDRPAAMNALAYAQGNDIHLGAGQEQHLPHEAWHVAQQKQGRVTPSATQLRGAALNDDVALEAEADVMGARALEVGAASTPGAPSPSGALPGAAPTPVVQRLKGAPGTKEAGKAVTFTISDAFKQKHVADDLAGAKEVTNNRIKSGSPAGIVAGTAANHVATEAAWTDAITASTEQVPPDGKWEVANGDDSEFVNQLARVEVEGWEAQGTLDNVNARAMTLRKYVGGTWKVADSEEDDDGGFKDGVASVSMEIDHLTS